MLANSTGHSKTLLVGGLESARPLFSSFLLRRIEQIEWIQVAIVEGKGKEGMRQMFGPAGFEDQGAHFD